MTSKYLLLLCAIFCNTFFALAQTNDTKIPQVDKSPMDISYFPDLYPLQKFQGKIATPPVCRVIYGRPQKAGRTLFGDLIKYNEVWRIGANESTEIEFYKNVTINGKAVTKGKYSLFCIPDSTNWTFIINKEIDSWGSFAYDAKKDIIRIKVPVKKTSDSIEVLSLYFNKNNKGAALNVAWDNYTASFDIIF